MNAHKHNFKFDSWTEYFDLDSWLDIFKSSNIDPRFYANRKRKLDEILPWDHIDCKINKNFLIKELEKAYASKTTPNCREACSNCGAGRYKEGVCIEKH